MIRDNHGIAAQAISLTFDDGPSEWTEAILDALEAHGAAATFFVLGCHVDGHPGTLKRAVALGCELGCHGWSHRPFIELADAELVEEIVATCDAIERVAGRRPAYWRPPYFRADERVRAAISSLGLEEVDCSNGPEDYLWSGAETARFVLEHLVPGDIVDLHDGRSAADTPEQSTLSREPTVEAVVEILGELAARGFRSVSVSELLRLA